MAWAPRWTRSCSQPTKAARHWAGPPSDAISAERRFLARLEHPNVARVIDGGTAPDGRPFVVMEYVDGAPIDRWCATRRLHTGRFVWLQRSSGDVLAPATLQLSPQQFEALTVGLPWQRLGELATIRRC